MASLRPGRNARELGSRARELADPRTTARAARETPGSTVFLIVGTLYAISALRTGTLVPSVEQGAAWIASAVALVMLAQVVPELVTATLLLVLLYVALTNLALLEELFSTWSSKLGAPGLGGGGGGKKHAP